MLYGLSLNKNRCTLMRWDTDRERVVNQPISWTNGMQQGFDSCIVFNGDSFLVGESARLHFISAASASDDGNLINGITMELLDEQYLHIPAKGYSLSGQQILDQFFEALGNDLRDRHTPNPGDGENMMVISGPAIMDPDQLAVFERCAEKVQVPVKVAPDWFLQTIYCINEVGTYPTGRVLYLDMGMDSACAAALLVSNDDGTLHITPRSIATHDTDVLSQRQVASWIVEEICSCSQDYRSELVPYGFHQRRDFLILSNEAERCRKHLMHRSQPITFSAADLYQGQFLEQEKLTSAWFAQMLERHEFTALVQMLIQQALMESGWDADSLSAVYITRGSGAPFRNSAKAYLNIAEDSSFCPVWQGSGSQTAEGAAIFAKLRSVQHPIICDPLTRYWLCCRTDTEDPGKLWHYVALYSQGSMMIPCRGATKVEFFLLDASIMTSQRGNVVMSNNRKRIPLETINIPSGTNVNLSVLPDGTGNFHYRFSDRGRDIARGTGRTNITNR